MREFLWFAGGAIVALAGGYAFLHVFVKGRDAMIANQGGTILAIDMEDRKVLFQSVDGKHQVCDVKAWFTAHGTKTKDYNFAETFAFEVDGFDLAGEPATTRYDGTLQGLGEPIPRAADGTFGTKASRRLNDDVQREYGREGVVQ